MRRNFWRGSKSRGKFHDRAREKILYSIREISCMQTVVHVTHEAIQKIGGIGAVLQGLLTSKTYLNEVPRNIA
jgi:hypothetical protein